MITKSQRLRDRETKKTQIRISETEREVKAESEVNRK